MEKNRLEAFSDGVLAIIITIMILEIGVPHDGTQWSILKPLIPVFMSYILSFLYIGIYWGNHHHLVNTVKKVTPAIMLTNLNLLFWLSLIPFATGWMGENHFERNAVVFYGIILLLAAIAYYVLQKSIEKSYNQDERLKYALKKHGKKGMFSLIGYCVSIPLAYVHPLLSLILFYGFAIIWIIPDRNIESALD